MKQILGNVSAGFIKTPKKKSKIMSERRKQTSSGGPIGPLRFPVLTLLLGTRLTRS